MFGQPVCRIFLGADDAGERRQILDRPLFDHEPGEDWRQKTSTRAVIRGAPFAVPTAANFVPLHSVGPA